MNSSDELYESMKRIFKKSASKHQGEFSENLKTSTLSLKLGGLEFHYLWGNRDMGVTSNQDMKFVLASDAAELRIDAFYDEWKERGTI